jgi:four helix bundle protein
MAGVRDHTELDAWKLSDQVRDVVDALIATHGFESRPKLREQLRDAAESACPNIAEGFSRFSPRDFARFLAIAKGSLTEVIEHSYRARSLGLISPDEFESLRSLARRARGAATGLILYLETADPPGRRWSSSTRRRR